MKIISTIIASSLFFFSGLIFGYTFKQARLEYPNAEAMASMHGSLFIRVANNPTMNGLPFGLPVKCDAKVDNKTVLVDCYLP